MSVDIPISTNPGTAVRGIEQITKAIDKAGQSGRKFAELDLSHPELEKLSHDIVTLQRNWEELLRIGRGRDAGAARKGQFEDVFDWWNRSPRQFTDKGEARRHRDNVSNYLSQGSSFSPSAAASREGSDGGDGLMGRLRGLIGPILGLAGITGIGAMAARGVSGASDEATSADTLLRILASTNQDFDEFRSHIRASAKDLQMTSVEMVRMQTAFAQASGFYDSVAVNAETRGAVGFARAFGMDPGMVSKMFGQARWLGAGGDTSPREMAAMFADAIAGGNMWSKADEVIGGIVRFADAAEKIMVDAPNTRAYANIAAAMNASGRPGLQGSTGEALLAAMNASVSRGGSAGEPGQAFIWRAMLRDGAMNPFQARYLQEEGLFGSRQSAFGSGSSTTTIESIMREIDRRYANRGSFERYDAMANLLGISMHQAAAFESVYRTAPGAVGRTAAMAGQYGIDLNQVSPTSFQMLAKIAAGGPDDLNQVRDELLSRDDLSPGQRQAIGRSTDLRQTLARVAARLDMTPTEGLQVKDSIVRLEQSLIEIGDRLLTPLNAIKATAGNILGVLNNPGRGGRGITDAVDNLWLGPRDQAPIDQLTTKTLRDPLYRSKFGGVIDTPDTETIAAIRERARLAAGSPADSAAYREGRMQQLLELRQQGAVTVTIEDRRSGAEHRVDVPLTATVTPMPAGAAP